MLKKRSENRPSAIKCLSHKFFADLKEARTDEHSSERNLDIQIEP